MDTQTAAEPPPQPVQGLNYFKTLLPLFQRLHAVGCERDTAGNRRLFYDDYCALIMLFLFNPLIDSLRALQQALKLPHVAQKVGVSGFSLGSFSESSAVFEPQMLLEIIGELAKELRPLSRNPALAEVKDALTLVDSTVLHGLPRLAAAACEQTRCTTSRDGRGVYGWRMHLQLDLELFAPHRVDCTGARNAGAARESQVLRASLQAGRCYVGDGGYFDRGLFDDIVEADSSYAIRIRENALFTVQEERLLSQQALDAGVVRDAIVNLGGEQGPPSKHPVRIVELQVKLHPQRRRGGVEQTDRLLIATSLLELPAELIALIYLYRYTVELFFRFFKHLLGMRHLLSQRAQGVQIQVYCAVIACMLISLQTSRRPNKRTVEMIGWFLLGLASEQDVLNHLNEPDRRGVKLRAKEELWKKLGY
jgi:hypothetical protein